MDTFPAAVGARRDTPMKKYAPNSVERLYGLGVSNVFKVNVISGDC